VWDRYEGNVVHGLRKHWDRGSLELIACSASHAYLPGLLPTPEGIAAQLRLGMRAFGSLVGRDASGMWLPECAYDPAFDRALADAGVKYTILDEHGVTHARPRPPAGVFAPIASPSGVAFFARDPASSAQVWSRESGYPGDPFYRDFYRDIGFDLPEELLRAEVGPFGTRVMTGLKYYRITGPGDHKEPYEPALAQERVRAHAHDFVEARRAQAQAVGASVIVSPYDAELFGHWWFEGPDFIEAVFRALARGTDGLVQAVTLGEHLAARPEVAVATPAPSSWGEGGYGEVWVGPASGYLWRHVHHATRYVKWLVDGKREETGFRGEVLDQVIRELLLLQSSDWAFILHTGTSTGYAEARVRAHVRRLRHLAYLLHKPAPDGADAVYLQDLRERDAFLSHFEGAALRDVF
jgi:1,4-alpha-glucan branching enzyme